LSPNDLEALATIAAIDATRSGKDVALHKAGSGVPVETPLIGFSSCTEDRRKNLAPVNEGISYLTKALQIDGGNIEFMRWLSQLLASMTRQFHCSIG